MRIPDAKQMLTSVFAYNMDQFQSGKSHDNFIVPYLVGEPGVGKTAAIKQCAEELEVPYHVTIIGSYDAGALGGFGIPTDVVFENEDGSEFTEKRVIMARPDYMPDPRTQEGVIGFWNLDELPQAFLSHQNICSQLVNTWKLGEHEISPGITIVATGNKAEHKAGTTTMPMHLKDRLMEITIEPHWEDWNDHANRRGINPLIKGFLRKNPTFLQKFTVGASASPTCRSWEKTSGIMSLNTLDHIKREMMWGQIGREMTEIFESYFKVADRMPDWRDIITDPLHAPVFGNQDADVLYLLLLNLIEIANNKNIEAQTKYMERLPNQEFTVMWVRDLCNRHPDMNNNKFITEYKLKNTAKIVV